MKLGAVDFVQKPFFRDELLMRVRSAADRRQLARQVDLLQRQMRGSDTLDALVGDSESIRRVKGLIGRAAAAPGTVLVTGDTGTGKELVARALHELGPSPSGPFVAVNCGALPRELAESELFGHERGAFTGAAARRAGWFEEASGGTLVLDEVGELPLDLQPKLLRVLETGRLRRVGGAGEIAVRARVVAMTLRNLEGEVARRGFREDLYYRLAGFCVRLPPLRERRGDIPLLVEHMLAKYAESLGERVIAADALDRLVGYAWPGNVRELENVIQRAMVMASAGVILPEHLPIGPVSAAVVGTDASLEEIIEKKMHECVRGLRGHTSANLHGLMVGLVEKPLLRAVMRETKGNQVRAAQLLGINRNTLRKKLKEHGIDPGGV